MRFLKYVIVNLLLSSISTGIGLSEASNHKNLAQTLNTEAEASDAAGIRKYSQHLVQLLLGENASSGFAREMAGHLANAETLARAGRRKLISESEIGKSFNDTMERIGAPSSLRVDVAKVHRFRLGPFAPSPLTSLISIDKNGDNCYPGEAVFLLILLIADNPSSSGRLHAGVKPEELPRTVGAIVPRSDAGASTLLSAYFSNHSQKDRIKLFEHMTQVLGF